MSEEGKTIGRRVAESAAREAEGSYADWWSTALIEQCRKGEREPMFTPPPDPGQSGVPSGESGKGSGGLFSGLIDLLTFQ